jgi:NTP pyrophosphatase (non-canonical NTP hydrolase)
MSDKSTTIQELKLKKAEFVKDRDWEQYHSPKNLSMSIAIEAAELMEKFQWIDNQKSKEIVEKNKLEIEEEIADIFSYILGFCNLYDIDLSEAFKNKLEKNKIKYPINKSKGKSDKYTNY